MLTIRPLGPTAMASPVGLTLTAFRFKSQVFCDVVFCPGVFTTSSSWVDWDVPTTRMAPLSECGLAKATAEKYLCGEMGDRVQVRPPSLVKARLGPLCS